jgi:hypothetical protein
MAGLVPAIHGLQPMDLLEMSINIVFCQCHISDRTVFSWMAASSAAMTVARLARPKKATLAIHNKQIPL